MISLSQLDSREKADRLQAWADALFVIACLAVWAVVFLPLVL